MIHLGLLFSNTGPAASGMMGFRAGANARIGVENAAGGVNGRMLTYDWVDDASGGVPNLAGARDLVEQKKDFAVLEASVASEGSAAYLHDQGVPVFGVGVDPTWTRDDNMFTDGTYVATSGATSTLGDFVRQLGGTAAAVLWLDFVPVGPRIAQAERQSLAAAHIPVAYNAGLTAEGSSLPKIANEIRASHADTIITSMTPDLNAALLASVRDAGVPLKAAISITGYDPGVLAQFGPALAGSYVMLLIAPFELNLPAQRTFIQAMARYAPEVQAPATQLTAEGWIETDLAIRGLRAAGACPTRQAVIAGLRTVTNYDAGGLLDPPRDLTRFRQTPICNSFVRVNPAGTGFTVAPGSPKCGHALP
jgi:branched-chain amino acid transport system substrate-binding protein